MTTHAMSLDDEKDFPPFAPKLVASIKKVGHAKGVVHSELDDFVQEVWLQARKSRASLPKKEPDRTRYIHAIARNLAKRRLGDKEDVEIVSLQSVGKEVAPVAYSSEAADLARKIVMKASERDAAGTQWVLEHHLYGEKQTDIAKEAGVDVEIVRKRIQRLMAFMRKYGSSIAMVLMVIFCAISGLLRRPKPEQDRPPQVDEQQTKKQEATLRRQRALAKCDAKLWEECLDDLDAARAEDPEGDLAPGVARAREEAERGLAAPTESRPPLAPTPFSPDKP
jgi:DNA-directed RNA polymerase specialized sigma24 family protein